MMVLSRVGQLLERRTIFISYRRNDSGGYAGQLFQELQRHYGGHALFLDHQDMEAGSSWPQRLTTALDVSDVVLVVVGPGWADARDDDGERRLDQPADWVRREVEAGL